MIEIDTLINTFVTLAVLIDPIGLVPIFLAVTASMTKAQRVQVAIRACLTGAVIITFFAIAGSYVLDKLGISLASFRIAGGILLFWTAFEMIFEKRHDRHEKSAERAVTIDQIRNVAIFPLAVPLIAGPGAISATILLSSSYSSPFERVQLIGLIFFILSLVFIAFLLANSLERIMGATGRVVLTRLLGVLLAALAIQFIGDGIKELVINFQAAAS